MARRMTARAAAAAGRDRRNVATASQEIAQGEAPRSAWSREAARRRGSAFALSRGLFLATLVALRCLDASLCRCRSAPDANRWSKR